MQLSFLRRTCILKVRWKWWSSAKLNVLHSESCYFIAEIKFSETGPDIQSINSCLPSVRFLKLLYHILFLQGCINRVLISHIDWLPVTWEDTPGGAVISEITGPSLVFNLATVLFKTDCFLLQCYREIKAVTIFLHEQLLCFCDKPVYVLPPRLPARVSLCSTSVLLICVFTKVSVHNSRYVSVLKKKNVSQVDKRPFIWALQCCFLVSPN